MANTKGTEELPNIKRKKASEQPTNQPTTKKHVPSENLKNPLISCARLEILIQRDRAKEWIEVFEC